MNIESVTIRIYKEGDFEQVWELHEKALKAAGAFVAGHGEWDEDLKDIPGVYLKTGGTFLVVEKDGKIIGMGALKKISNKVVEIKRMRVLPEFQGRGLGTKLLKILEERASELGYTRLVLDTTVKQEAAIHLYQKFGYREFKRGMLGGLETIWMEKEL